MKQRKMKYSLLKTLKVNYIWSIVLAYCVLIININPFPWPATFKNTSKQLSLSFSVLTWRCNISDLNCTVCMKWSSSISTLIKSQNFFYPANMHTIADKHIVTLTTHCMQIYSKAHTDTHRHTHMHPAELNQTLWSAGLLWWVIVYVATYRAPLWSTESLILHHSCVFKCLSHKQ